MNILLPCESRSCFDLLYLQEIKFIGGLGSVLGFYLGLSLLTIFEGLELIIDFIYLAWHHRRKKHLRDNVLVPGKDNLSPSSVHVNLSSAGSKFTQCNSLMQGDKNHLPSKLHLEYL